MYCSPFRAAGLVVFSSLVIALAAGLAAGDVAPPPINHPDKPLQIFLVAGQSNAVGFGDPALLPAGLAHLANPQDDTGLYYMNAGPNAGWLLLGPGTGDRKDANGKNVEGGGFGPELLIGRTLSDSLDADVAIVKHAVGGSFLAAQAAANDWNAASTNELLDQLLGRVLISTNDLTSRGIAWEIAGMFWMQGEQDTTDPAAAAAYAANLAALIDRVRTDLAAPTLPFIIGQLGDNQTKLDATNRTLVQNAQATVADADAYAGFVTTHDLPMHGDNVHFNTDGQVILGQRFAASYLDNFAATVPEPGAAALSMILLAIRTPRRAAERGRDRANENPATSGRGVFQCKRSGWDSNPR